MYTVIMVPVKIIDKFSLTEACVCVLLYLVLTFTLGQLLISLDCYLCDVQNIAFPVDASLYFESTEAGYKPCL